MRDAHIIQAAQLGSTNWLRALLAANCDVNALTVPAGQTPVMLAASKGFLHCVKALVEAGASLTVRDAENHSCLDLCSTEQGRGCLRTIKLGLGLLLPTFDTNTVVNQAVGNFFPTPSSNVVNDSVGL